MKNAWPELKYVAVSRFIGTQVREYRRYFYYAEDEEEFTSEAWRAYLDASYTYHKVEGCCSFPIYASSCIHESLEKMRADRANNFFIENFLSLDFSFEGSNETIGTRYFRKTGDFTNAIALWDFAWRQGKEKYQVLRKLGQGFLDNEIMEEIGLSPEKYYGILEELQQDFRQWLAI